MKKTLTLLLLFSALFSSAQNDIRTIYAHAMEAYQAKDFATFLKDFKTLDSLSPMHPTITYNLGAAYALNGYRDEAIMLAKKAIGMNIQLQPETDEDYKGILSEADVKALTMLNDYYSEEVKNGAVAFKNEDVTLHPESIAYDPKEKAFYVSSVRQGKILKYNPATNTFSDFVTGRWAVMGIKVQDKFLWSCEVATNEWVDFDEQLKGKTALTKFDLKTGKQLERYELEGGHWFGDLHISASGKVYISDSQQPIIYTLGRNGLVVFQDFSNKLYNLQGICTSPDEKLLYIADYKIGIHVLDMNTQKLEPLLSKQEEVMTKGTDGLYWYNNQLISLQNGVNPFRVTKYTLSSDGRSINSQDFLDKARAQLKEPTLGVVVGSILYYVANSPWGAYKDGQFISEGLSDNLIMKVDLGN